MNVSNTTSVLPNYRVLSINQIMIQVSSIIFPSIFLAFDTILLLSTIESRRDSSIPYAYLMVMSLRGVLANFILLLQPCVYLIATLPGYFEFTELMGREATLLGNFSYLVALVISVLMSVNRVAVVMKPMNTWFDNTRVFIYCGIIAILMLISLLIPYFSPCDINFDMTRLAFISGCAPGRHPITTFQNTYAIVLPVSCMFVNLSIIFHLRFVRNNSYATFMRKFRKVEPARSTSQSTFISKQRAKKDMMMIRQTITMAAYLSFYEFGAVIIKIFPALYVGLSPAGKLLYFYVRMEAVAFMNFLIYFVESKKTRIMVCRYLKIGTKPGSSLITVSQHRTVSGSTGNVATVTN